MIEHRLFPTLVGEFHYPEKDKFKQLFVENIFKYTTQEGYSNEYSGHVTLHHEKNFENLFKFASEAVETYIERLHIDTYKFDINIVKTWMNIKKNATTPRHAHHDAHLSFTYYVNMPEDCSLPIRFYCPEPKSEPYQGSIQHNNTKNLWDDLNSYTHTFTPIEGQLLVFPSSIQHDTIGYVTGIETGINEQNILHYRLCLAGDILLTYKEKTASPLGIQPVYNWRNFL